MLMGRTILPGQNIKWIDMVSLKKVSLVLKIIVSIVAFRQNGTAFCSICRYDSAHEKKIKLPITYWAD